MTEHEIQKAIIKATRDRVDWMRNNVGVSLEGGRYTRYGVGGKGGSDLIGILRANGRFVACEIKRPGKHPTESQQEFLDRVTYSGGLAFCAHSVEEAIVELGE